MTGQGTPEETHGAILMPHQAAFIERFFTDYSKRGHLLRSDVGLGTFGMVAQLIKRAVDTQQEPRILLFARKMFLMQMCQLLNGIGVDAQMIDRFRYRELQDVAPAGGTVWHSGVFLLSMDFAEQAEITSSLAAAAWSLVVVLEPHLFLGVREQTIRQLVTSLPNLRVVLIASRDVEDLPTFGIDQFTETEWRRAQVLASGGEQLIAQPPTHLEVIEFQDGPAERQLQDTLKDAVDVVRSTNGAASLLAENLLRAINSSPAAAEEVVRRLRNRVVHGPVEFPDPEAERDDEEDTDELIASAGEIDTRLAEVLDRCLVGLESQVVDSKLNALVQHLVASQIRGRLPEAICILTQYRSTLFYVQTELEQRGLRTYLLHSSMNFDQQSRAILEFEQRKGVLVATNASLAGFELPHVDVVIFYDLPRSPMMLQQLLGRFWRVGRSTALNLIALSRPEGAHPMTGTILGKLRIFVHGEDRFGIVESD